MIQSLTINEVTIPNNLFLAPLAGFSDIAMRQLCRDFGAGLTVTEMVSAKALLYNNPKTTEMLRIASNESPACVQLFGSDPAVMQEVVRNHPALEPFDIIDINMGCPVRKVTAQGEGSALLKNVKQAAAIVQACAKATLRPITVKMRIGWEEAHDAQETARRFADSGAALLTVHGRTAKQMYGGKADWSVIEQVADSVDIPVIGNGDIGNKEQAFGHLSGAVAGIMIGRGAIGNPQLFAEILGRPADAGKKLLAIRHILLMQQYFPERYVVTNMRKHLHFYLRGARDNKRIKDKINRIERTELLLDELRQVEF